MDKILDQITQSFQGYTPKLLAAIAILIIGWIFARIIAAIVRKGLKRTGLGGKLADALGDSVDAPDVERNVGKGVYYLIMIMVLVAIFQVLDLTIVTNPLNGLLSKVFGYIPSIIGAVILVIIAWLIATILRLIVTKALVAVKLDERVSKSSGSEAAEEEEAKSVSLSKNLGDVVFGLVFLLFLPSILGALGMTGLLEPVQGMLDKLLGFLPNVLVAGIIVLVGWFVAKLVRSIVTNLLAAVGLDKLGDRIGMSKASGGQGLSGVLGLIVYIFILIPVLLAALNALQLDAITQPISNMLNIILAAIPSIFAAAIVIIVSYLIGRVVCELVANLLAGVGFNGLMAKIGWGKNAGEGKALPSAVVGKLILVAIILFAAIEACSMLGFTALVDMSASFMVLAGHVALGLVILGVGLYLASLAAKAIHSSGNAQAGLLANVARVAILMLVGAIALRQMGLANEIISLAFGLLLGALAIAVAIAFGIGGREVAARKLEQWTKPKENG